jgi:O-antigen/teichoic acid export membrane protein
MLQRTRAGEELIFNRLAHAKAYVASTGLGPLLVRSIAGSGSVRLVASLASFAVGVELARGLGASGYGNYGIALSIMMLAGIPGELGVSRVVTREVSAATAKNDFAHLFGVLHWADRTVLAISGLMMIGVLAAGLLLTRTRGFELGLAMLLGAPMIPFMAFARLRGGALQGLHYIVRGQIPANVLRPVILSILISSTLVIGAGLAAPVAMALTTVSSGAAAIVAHVWLKQRLPNAQPPEIIRLGRRWIASSIPMALTDGMQTLQSELCVLLLGLTSGAAVTGLFRIANVAAATVATAGIVMAHVGMPVIARLHAEGDRERLQKAVTALAWGQIGGVLLLSLPLLIAPAPLLIFAFGPSFEAAAGATRILAVGQIANAAFGPTATLLNMTHNERRVTRAMTVAVATAVVLLPPLASKFQTTGAAVALVISLLIWNVLTWRDAHRLLGIETSALRSPWTLLRDG